MAISAPYNKILLSLLLSIVGFSCYHPIFDPIHSNMPFGIYMQNDTRLEYYLKSRNEISTISGCLRESVPIDYREIKPKYTLTLANGNGEFSNIQLSKDVILFNTPNKIRRCFKLPNYKLEFLLDNTFKVIHEKNTALIKEVYFHLKNGNVKLISGLTWYLKDNSSIELYGPICDENNNPLLLKHLLAIAPNKQEIKIYAQ